MKKKVSILIVSILIISAVGVSIGQLKDTSILGFFNHEKSKDETKDLSKDIELEDTSNLEENLEENLQTEETKLREKLIRVDSNGAVAVGVTFLNPIEDSEDYLSFEVILDTHSVELDQYNLGNMATLFIGDEIKITEGLKWETEGSGHHMIGYLKSPRNYEGKIIDYLESDFIELEINDLDGVASRKFRWEKEEITL